jgi:hypothetical protein
MPDNSERLLSKSEGRRRARRWAKNYRAENILLWMLKGIGKLMIAVALVILVVFVPYGALVALGILGMLDLG